MMPVASPTETETGAYSGPDPTQVVGRRVGAALIDGVVIGVPAAIAATSEFEYLELDQTAIDPDDFCDSYLDQYDGVCINVDGTVYYSESPYGVGALTFLGLGLLVYVVLQGLTGWTPGKLLTGIRTVRPDGKAPGLGRAFLRWLLLLVDGQPVGIPLVGFICALTTTGHRRVGDMAAKTFVVRASAMGAPVAAPGSAPPPGGPAESWRADAGAAPAPEGGPSWGPLSGPGPEPEAAPEPEPDPAADEASWAAPAAAPPTFEPSPAPPAPDPEPMAEPMAEPPEAAPEPEPEPAAEPAEATETATADPYGPRWDEARGTYIQWDPNRSLWLQWDEGAQSWDVIPGQ